MIIDPVELSMLLAAPDDEPVTEAEQAEVDAARNDPRPSVPHDEILKEFGVT